MTEYEPPGPDEPSRQDEPPRHPGAMHWPGGQHGTPDQWAAWMRRAEHLAAGHLPGFPVPAWLRSTRGEHRWPISLSVIVAIVLQLLLAPQFIEPFPRYVMPGHFGAASCRQHHGGENAE